MPINKKNQVINLEKGKSLYFEYYGNKFAMYHDLGDEYADCNVPKDIEEKWKAEILRTLGNEITALQGSDLQDAVSRYMHLLPASDKWLMRFLTTREIDTFTAIIFCEQLKNMARTFIVKKIRVRRFLDKFKAKLLNEPVSIHESYKNASFMQDYDFSENAIKKRIKAI